MNTINNTLTLKVLIVGLKGNQRSVVESLLRPYGLRLRFLGPKELLCRKHLGASIIVLTRFMNHKHSQHAEIIAPHAVILRIEGTCHSIAKAILDVLSEMKYCDIDQGYVNSWKPRTALRHWRKR